MPLHDISGAAAIRELSYVEQTTSVSITSTSEASPTDIVSAAAIILDGGTRINVEFFCIDLLAPAGQAVILNLWDASTDLGRFGVAGGTNSSAVETAQCLRRFLTPSNGSHTYKVRGWTTSGTGTAAATSPRLPIYIRVTTV